VPATAWAVVIQIIIFRLALSVPRFTNRVMLENPRRLAQCEHQRLGSVGRRRAAFACPFLGFNLEPPVRVDLVEDSGELADGRFIG
jgi:hypothetical protein